jgi:hypothetical protein
MSNTSATGGPLLPAASPAVLEGDALVDYLQQIVVGVTGLPGNAGSAALAGRAAEHPAGGTDWAAIGITTKQADTFAYVEHDGTGDGSDTVKRHEILRSAVQLLRSRPKRAADEYAARLRDGLSVAQNREPLTNAGMGLVSVGDATAVPSLLKERWLYRTDITVTIRREIRRTYPVLNIVSADIVTSHR